MVHCRGVPRETNHVQSTWATRVPAYVALSSVPSRAARSLPPPESAKALDLGEVDTGEKANPRVTRRTTRKPGNRGFRRLSSPWRVGAPLSLAWAAGKHEEARLKYVQAYAVLKFPGVLFNLARAEMTVGRDVEAYKLFRDFLKMPQTDLDRSMLARKYYGELAKKVSLVTVSATTPKGTKVIIDGVDSGETPLAEPIVVAAGTHDIVLRYADKEKKSPVSCPLSQTVTVELEVKDDKGPGPITPPPGEKGEKGSWLVPGVLAGVGVVGLGVGIGLGAASGAKGGDAATLARGGACADLGSAACKEAQDGASSASGLGTGSVIGYVAGGAFLGAAVISTLIIKPWVERPRRITIHPGFGGATVVGTF